MDLMHWNTKQEQNPEPNNGIKCLIGLNELDLSWFAQN